MGFLAAFLGMGGEYEFIFNQYNNLSGGEWSGLGSWLQFIGGSGQDFLAVLSAAVGELSWSTLLALVIFLALLFILAAMVIIAQGALISGAASAARDGRVRILDALRVGYKSFWSLLAIIISTRLLAFFVLVVVGVPIVSILLALDESLVSSGASIILFVLGLPLFVLFSLVAKFAVTYRVVEGERWRSALAKSFALFAGHWLVTIELALIVFIVNILTAVFFIFVALVLAIPFILLGIIIADLAYVFVLKALVTTSLVLFLLILLVLGSALSTFQNTVWTVLFLKIKDAPRMSKLLRMVHSVKEKYG